jgi:hypothetical protein
MHCSMPSSLQGESPSPPRGTPATVRCCSVLLLSEAPASTSGVVECRQLRVGDAPALPETDWLEPPSALHGLAAACVFESTVRGIPCTALVGVSPSREPQGSFRAVARSLDAAPEDSPVARARVSEQSERTDAWRAAVRVTATTVGSAWANLLYT